MPKIAELPAKTIPPAAYRLGADVAEELSLCIALLGRDAADVAAGTVLTSLRFGLNRRCQEKAAACLRVLRAWAAGDEPDVLDWVTALCKIEWRPEEDAAAEAEERRRAQAAEDEEDNAKWEARQREKEGRGRAG